MEEKMQLIQEKLELVLKKKVSKIDAIYVKKWLDSSEKFIAGFATQEEGSLENSTLIIFAMDKEEDVFCRIANGVLYELLPKNTDEMCLILKKALEDRNSEEMKSSDEK